MTDGGVLKQDFTSLFTIDSSNQYDLIATMTDNTGPYCGTYECVDDNGARDADRANATVASKYMYYYTPCPDKKGATLFLLVTLRNANRFSKFFYHHTLQ